MTDLPPGARRQRIDGTGRWFKDPIRRTHPHPAARTYRNCVDCRCRLKGRINRRLCEDRYQRAIQDIITDIRKGDPSE